MRSKTIARLQTLVEGHVMLSKIISLPMFNGNLVSEQVMCAYIKEIRYLYKETKRWDLFTSLKIT